MNVSYSKKWDDLRKDERKISYHSSGWVKVPAWDQDVFELDDAKPLMCRVFVEPLRVGRAQIGILDRPDTPSQSALIFPATNLFNERDDKPVQDLTYHIHFFNEERGNNPDYTLTSFPSAKT